MLNFQLKYMVLVPPKYFLPSLRGNHHLPISPPINPPPTFDGFNIIYTIGVICIVTLKLFLLRFHACHTLFFYFWRCTNLY